jgi:RNA polymerase sigma factor (sigma-70 family)
MNQYWTITPDMTAEKKQHISSVVNDYRKRLLGFIRKRVNSEDDAQDILQDVFYQFVGNTEPIGQLTAWLFRVTRNKIIDRQRKQQPVSLDSMFAGSDDETAFEWSDILFDDSKNPETEYLKNMFWQTLHDALAELPAAQREIFELNEMQGIPFKEIAAQTGEAVNTLISRKRYAVLHLRERLGGLRDELLNY